MLVTNAWRWRLSIAVVDREILSRDDDLDLCCFGLAAFAAGDADGERENLFLTFEGEGARSKGEDARGADGEEIFFVSFADGIVECFA